MSVFFVQLSNAFLVFISVWNKKGTSNNFYLKYSKKIEHIYLQS